MNYNDGWVSSVLLKLRPQAERDFREMVDAQLPRAEAETNACAADVATIVAVWAYLEYLNNKEKKYD
jgi:hypothetical protein